MTETVQDIMNRGNPAENRQPGQTLRIVPIGRADRQNLNQDPNAPDVPRWPYSGGAGSMGRQPASDVVSPGEGPLAPQTVGVSVVAATSADSPFIPPDSMGAVGPTQALAIENGIIRTFNKSGAPDGAIDTSTDNFFDSVRNAAGTSDPQVTFDRISNRWFIEMITVTPPNRIMIAMSSGPAIASASSFTLFQFQQDLVGTTPNSDTGGLADQGRLGVDKNALYIAANIFNAAGTSFIGSTGFVVRKSDLILNNTLTVTAFRQLGTGSASGPFAPQGVDNDDPNATEGYFIGVDTLLFGRLQIRRITDPGGSPSISANLSLTVPATASPIRVPAQGSIRPLDGGDDRLIMAQIKKGSLWAAHQIQVNSSGNASNSGGRDGVRWYQITNLTGTPTLNQSGTLFDSSATNPVYYFYGSPAASGQGHMALASSYAANMPFAGGTIQGYPGVAYTGRLATDAPGTLNTSINRTLGVGAYNVQSTNPQRWGDYSKTTVDPNDDMTMWTFQERSNSSTGNGSWGVIMTQLKAPPPATPSSASPSFAGAGAKLNVAITGTPNSGSGFFDPGSGFPNHISAAVNGGGVTINGITFNTPANITLNVTVDSGATPGNRTVTVTNPDGQQATSASGIFTINAASITLSPATLPYGVVGASYNQTITASGGTSPYTFGILAGALPHGLTLSSGGMISGTLTTSGTADFTVGVQDSLFATGNRAYTFKVADVISSNVSLSVTSTRFDPTPSPGFEGKYTFNTTLTNNGRALGSPVFFKITDLRKVGTDLNPAQPDKLLSADNGAGLVGDIETVGMASLGTGASTPVTFLIGIGSRQAFRFGIDLYGVVPGTAITSLDNVTLKTAVVVTPAAAILLGRFQFEISEGKLAVLATRHSIFSAPDTNANVAVITGPGPQSRPVVAVDPILASRMAVASNDYAAGTVQVKSSLDGGKTWHAAEMSRTLGEQSFFAAHNPGLAFDSRGNLSVVYTLSNLNDAANAIVISESEDGIHFSPPAAISFHPASDRIIDSRPVIAIRHGTGRYVAWDSLSTQTGRYDVKVVQSVDSGPFGPAVNVVSNSLVSSAALAVSRNKLYVGWDEWGFNSSFPYTTGGRLMMSSARLGRELLFSELQELARTGIGFSRKIAPMPERGASPDLRLAVDPKKNNVVYAVFADQGNGIDVLYTVSNNGGRTWQPPVVVNDDTSFADQFDPAIGLDSRGTLNIAFYDTRLSSTSTAADVFMASSSSGNRFAANKRITTIGSDDSTANPSRDYIANLGDRIGVAAVTDNAIVVWTDTRLGSEDIFLSIVGNQ
ncbi:MAG TPA: Ig domain-containing protein [Terriglobia bacterium]|nr:Ig domain-containing protein [Terriglobia bacterium]